MKVILRQNVENLGTVGEIVNVKDGYARNYLIPRALAYFASPKAIKMLDSEKKRYEAQMLHIREQAELMAARLAEVQLTISMQAGEEDRLFGSVTNQVIAQELEDRGFKLDRRTIILDEPIKALGTYDVKIKLHPEVSATIKVWVISA